MARITPESAQILIGERLLLGTLVVSYFVDRLPFLIIGTLKPSFVTTWGPSDWEGRQASSGLCLVLINMLC